MTWRLGLARLAAVTGGDLQRASRTAGGGEALWAASPEALRRHLRVDAETLEGVLAARSGFDAPAEERRLAARGVAHVARGCPGYPPALAEIPDPPFGLFTRGDWPDLAAEGDTPVVAIVGSRRPTSFGLAFARDLAGRLAERGAVVVSGMALGIDAAAHQGALRAAGRTLAVLGGGVDVPSPRRHAGLYADIVANGAVASEYWPGTPPAPWRFPARNRIVAGIADAVVVVEAGERSGALITADFAMEQGRPVLAVPGSPAATTSAGCNALLRAGAAMCEADGDVVDEIPGRRWDPPTRSVAVPPGGIDRDVRDLLLSQPLRSDEIAARLEHDAATVAAALARLELDGLILRGEAQRYWAAPLRGAA